MDRFLLCENPNRPNETGLFILHRLEPQMLIQCICLNDEEMDSDLTAIFDIYEHRNLEGITERWQLIVRDYYQVDSVEHVSESEVPRYRKALTKAWHWYKAYMEWEDKNIDIDDRARYN